MNSSRCIRCLAVVLLFAGANRAPANEIRMPRHPDYSEGKIVFSYLGDLWLVNDDGSNPAPADDARGPRFASEVLARRQVDRLLVEPLRQ